MYRLVVLFLVRWFVGSCSMLVGVDVMWCSVCVSGVCVLFVYFSVSDSSSLSFVVFGVVLLNGSSFLLLLIGV